jgi:hypothetical protein
MRNKRISMQIDEATDCNGIGHSITYVPYVEHTAINEELLKIVDDFMKQKSKWSKYRCSLRNGGK